MVDKKTSFIYKCFKKLISTFYIKYEIEGLENLPESPSIVVGNHTQMNGPLVAELRLPFKRYIWCAGEMMHAKEVPSYAFKDFWSQKPKWTHWFYKILSYIITPIAVVLFNNAHTIAVRRDGRVITTFKETIKKLEEGNHIIIFPEHDVKYNHILYDFQDRFIDIAKLYYGKTKQSLSFVPFYIAPKLRKVYFGKPIEYQPQAPIEEEWKRIRDYLMTEITEIACGAPEHTVIPYRNIPKKDYPRNKGM